MQVGAWAGLHCAHGKREGASWTAERERIRGREGDMEGGRDGWIDKEREREGGQRCDEGYVELSVRSLAWVAMWP